MALIHCYSVSFMYQISYVTWSDEDNCLSYL